MAFNIIGPGKVQTGILIGLTYDFLLLLAAWQ